MKKLIKDKGFSLVAAIFLLVVVASLGVFMITIGSTQQYTSTFSILGTRALFAAQSGIEWAARQAVQAAGAGLACTVPPVAPGQITFNLTGGAASGYSVTIFCNSEGFSEGPDNYTVYKLTSTADRGTLGTIDRVSRTIRASVTDAP